MGLAPTAAAPRTARKYSATAAAAGPSNCFSPRTSTIAQTDPLHDLHIVGHKDKSGAVVLEGLHPLVTASLKRCITHSQHFIHQKNVRIDMGGYGKTQPGVHAGRVPLDRRIQIVPDLGEVDDPLEAIVDLARFIARIAPLR